MGLLLIGVNHKTAPIAIRERLVISSKAVVELTNSIISRGIALEIVIVFTCNRTEFYFFTKSNTANAAAIRWFKRYWFKDFKDELQSKYYYSFFDSAVVQHIMRVASGLDSMVLGETEIFGQLKAAYGLAQANGGVGKWLGRLFQQAFAAAKLVRSQTKIGVNSLSVAQIAVRLAGLIFADIATARVLVIGAGENAKLIIKQLCAVGVQQIWLVNRQQRKIIELAYSIDANFAWRFIELANLPQHLGLVDIVISSTASELPIIGKGMVESALKVRKHKPMLMIDLAVPRDIEAEVGKLADVYLYCIDDLQIIAAENKRLRHDEVHGAEQIIAQQSDKFAQWQRSQDWVGAITGIRNNSYLVRDACLARSLQQLQHDKDPQQVVRYLAHNLTNRLLHLPMIKLRAAGLAGDVKLLKKIEQIFADFDLGADDVTAEDPDVADPGVENVEDVEIVQTV